MISLPCVLPVRQTDAMANRRLQPTAAGAISGGRG
jgi:hypothetical protein